MRNVHWLTPAAMVGALFAGFLCALGHHLFYASLAGSPAPTELYEIAGASISRQQLNTAVGTAFGFLVKSLLTITIATAFVQAFWRAIRMSAHGPTLKSLDTTFAVLSNIGGLLDLRAWRSFRLPLLLAVIAWMVPIASIVTPATLSVQARAVIPAPSNTMNVPKLDFTSQNFAAPIPKGSRGYCFNGPSQSVERVATAVAAQGQILSISAPGPNATWELDFTAPSMSCRDVEMPKRTALWDHIRDQWGNVSDCSYAYGYMAWAATEDDVLPFVQPGANSSTRILQSAQLTYDAPASIYVATMPEMFNFAFMPSDSLTPEKCRFFGSDSLIYTYPIAEDVCLPGLEPPGCYGQQAWLTNATLLQCDLLETTYHANFQYKDGEQNITVNTDFSDPVVPKECVYANSTVDETYAKLTSYQAISSAFNQLVLGSITMGGYGTPRQGIESKLPGVIFDSNVATTVLMETEELAFIVNFDGVNQTFDYLQTTDADQFPSRQDIHTGRRGDLRAALETLFQNITISLLADEMLHPNYSSPYAPAQQSLVTFNRYQNVYIYSAGTLWVAYGLAIFFTIVALILGMWSLIQNEGSFTNDFSTILRTSRAAELSEALRDEDRDGRQPLPRRLASARIKIDHFSGDASGPHWSSRAGKQSSGMDVALLLLNKGP